MAISWLAVWPRRAWGAAFKAGAWLVIPYLAGMLTTSVVAPWWTGGAVVATASAPAPLTALATDAVTKKPMHARESPLCSPGPNCGNVVSDDAMTRWQMATQTPGASPPAVFDVLGFSMTPSERPPLAFIHIGKSGGTSFDQAMRRVACPEKMIQQVRWCSRLNRKYLGFFHFDYSYVAMAPSPQPEVLVLLRHPVARAISHFNFAKTLSWTAGRKLRDMSLAEYLNDPQEMLETRWLWGDGDSAVAWLTGTVHQSSVKPAKTAADLRLRDRVRQDTAASLYLAASRLKSAFWVRPLCHSGRASLSTTCGCSNAPIAATVS